LPLLCKRMLKPLSRWVKLFVVQAALEVQVGSSGLMVGVFGFALA